MTRNPRFRSVAERNLDQWALWLGLLAALLVLTSGDRRCTSRMAGGLRSRSHSAEAGPDTSVTTASYPTSTSRKGCRPDDPARLPLTG